MSPAGGRRRLIRGVFSIEDQQLTLPDPIALDTSFVVGLPRLSTGGMSRYRISEVDAWLRERYGAPSEASQPRNR